MPGYTGANVPTTTSYLDWVPIKEFFVNNQSSVEFKHTNDGVVLDNTYRVYKWEFINIHPATNSVNFTFQVNAEGESGYNETITSSTFRAYLKEDGTGGALGYDSGSDQAQGTAYQRILSTGTGNENDECSSGVLTLYAPSSTTFVKHFIAEGNGTDHGNWSVTMKTAGYINTTSKINEISFKFSSGNIGAGKIIMYGLPA